MTHGRRTALTLSLLVLGTGVALGAAVTRLVFFPAGRRASPRPASPAVQAVRQVAAPAIEAPVRRSRRGPRGAERVAHYRQTDSAAAAAPRLLYRPAPVAPERPDTEPVVVDLQIGRFASRTVQAYRARTEVLIPLTQFLQMAEVLFRMSPDGRLEATLDPGHRRILVDARSDTMAFGDHRVRVEPEFKLFVDGELYIGAERLGDLLDLDIVVDWTDLTVTVMDPSTLPIARRVRREAARDAFLRRAEGPQAELRLGLERPRWGGLVFDYSVFSPSEAPIAGGAYTAALGADAFGGSLELGVTSLGGIDRGTARVDASWTGVWRDNRWIKQLRLGDGVSTGPRVRTLRGFSITNAPFIRPSLVGATRYSGNLEPGWTVEAYRGGDLVAYDSTSATGGFSVELPVRYGENPVDFIAYGPFGEIRQFNRTYRVLNELLPARQFEYGAAAGDCAGRLCAATANLDLRYGVSRRWTVQGGFDQNWRDSLADAFHPYAAVTGTPTTAWSVVLEAVGRGFARTGLRYEPSLNLRLEGDFTSYTSGGNDPLVAPLGLRSQWSLFGFLRPTTNGFFFLQGSVGQTRSLGGGRETRTQIGASLQASEVRLLPYIRTVRDAGGVTLAYVGTNAFFLPRPELGHFLGQVWGRANLEAERVQGLSQAAAFVGRNLSAGVRLEAGVNYQRGTPGATFILTLATYLPAVRTVTAISAPAQGPVTGTQFVQGSVLWDRTSRRLALAPGPSLERSGLAGTVFMDENGNGRRDPSEPGMPRVRVLVGTHSALSDSNGVFRVWDIVPFEPILVAVDSLSLDSPLLVPGFASASVVPGPNRFRALDLPIVQAGVIEGMVVREVGGVKRGIGGVTLLLTDTHTGARRSLVSFTDGGFYLLGVKPGDYSLTVDPRALDALNATADAVVFPLTAGVGGVGKSGIEVVLRPKS